jgi:hypothetical protein
MMNEVSTCMAHFSRWTFVINNVANLSFGSTIRISSEAAKGLT